jgi:hypothetical protein
MTVRATTLPVKRPATTAGTAPAITTNPALSPPLAATAAPRVGEVDTSKLLGFDKEDLALIGAVCILTDETPKQALTRIFGIAKRYEEK